MQPQSPNPDYDFILKDNKPAGRGFSMPNLSKPVLIGLAAVMAIIVIIIAAALLGGRKNGSLLVYEGVLARGQETIRVTKLAQQLQLQDPQTRSLAATVSTTLTSDQKQLISYLAKNNMKVPAVALAANTDKTTDTSLQSAAQNNRLDAAYVDYLRNALSRYQTDLQSALNITGPNGKKIISSSSEGTRALLNSAPIKP